MYNTYHDAKILQPYVWDPTYMRRSFEMKIAWNTNYLRHLEYWWVSKL